MLMCPTEGLILYSRTYYALLIQVQEACYTTCVYQPMRIDRSAVHDRDAERADNAQGTTSKTGRKGRRNVQDRILADGCRGRGRRKFVVEVLWRPRYILVDMV